MQFVNQESGSAIKLTLSLSIDDVRPSGSSQSQPKAFAFRSVSGRINSYETREAPNPKGCDHCKKKTHPHMHDFSRWRSTRSRHISKESSCVWSGSHEGISCVIAKSLIVALRATAAITPYYTEATPPHRLQILLRDPDQDQIHPFPPLPGPPIPQSKTNLRRGIDPSCWAPP